MNRSFCKQCSLFRSSLMLYIYYNIGKDGKYTMSETQKAQKRARKKKAFQFYNYSIVKIKHYYLNSL